ncbi:unnamed protein product [Discula destructiva]
MSSPLTPLTVAQPDFDEGALRVMDAMDPQVIETEIVDKYPHLLDPQDDMDHPRMAPFKSARPSPPAPMTHPGPPAAKPEVHSFLPQHRQNPVLSSPPALTHSPGPDSPRVISSSFAHRCSSRQERSSGATSTVAPALARQQPYFEPATVTGLVGVSSTSRDHYPSRQPVAAKQPSFFNEHTFHKESTPRKHAAGRQPRQPYGSHRGSFDDDHRLSRQRSRHESFNQQLRQKISDLSLNDEFERQEKVGQHSGREQSPYDDHAGPSHPRRHALHHDHDAHFSQKLPRNTDQSCYPAVEDDFDLREDQASSAEWEEESDEHGFESDEEIPSNLDHEIYSGYQRTRTTDEELKYQTLVVGEAAARLTLTLGIKLYETTWTSQVSQKMRKAALRKVRRASSRAGRAIMAGTPVGGVTRTVQQRYTTLRTKPAPGAASKVARWSVIKAVQLSGVSKLAEMASVGLNSGKPEPAIDEDWEVLDESTDDVFQKSVVTEPVSRRTKTDDESDGSESSFFGVMEDY